MTLKIPENTRQTVIRLWLEGKSRKDIALICGVSEGTGSNIVSDWGQKLGKGGDAEALRELGSNLKRTGIDAAQCAQGFRNSMIMKKMGVNEEDFESFVHEVYEYCQRLDMTPENIASNLQALVKLSKDIPFAKIPEYIEKKKNEITKLEKDAKILKEKKEILEIEAAVAKDLRDEALEDEKTTVAEVREYSNLKAELKKYGLSIVDDIPKFTQVIHGIKQRGYDVDKVLSEYSVQEIKQLTRDLLINQVKGLNGTKMGLQNECYFLKSQVDQHTQRLYVYDELKSMGFVLRVKNNKKYN
jgi:hypothetical protein